MTENKGIRKIREIREIQYSISTIDTPELTQDEFCNMSDLFDTKVIRKFKIKDICNVEMFEDTYKNKIVSLNKKGNLIFVLAESKFNDVPEGFYVWEDIETEEDLSILNTLIKTPITTKKLRSTHIYKGEANTGAHLHNHNYAVNYLIKGKKIWYIFPDTEHNKNLLKEDGYIKMKKQRMSASIWIERKKRLMMKFIEGFQVIEQNEGEVICIPDQWFHLVLNVEPVIGVSYSW